MWSHACVDVCAQACVYEKGKAWIVGACICQKTSVRTYGLTDMQTLQRWARGDQCPGSKCRTQLTGPFLFHHVTLQMSRRRPPSVPNTHTQTLLDLISVELKQTALWRSSEQSLHQRRNAHWLSLVYKSENAARGKITCTITCTTV